MDRYFFDIQCGGEFFADEEGLDFPRPKIRRDRRDASAHRNGERLNFFKRTARYGDRGSLRNRAAVLRVPDLSQKRRETLRPPQLALSLILPLPSQAAHLTG
ncbi:hypothetical protein ACE103_25605 [Bradyrhizobium sp. ma5]|uniref:hypothetical protein n=1 Tax=Bradyrhizobium sp. ma5 TaxID=3344828 RepID=UPI0035D3F1DE